MIGSVALMATLPASADGSVAGGAAKVKTFGCISCHGRDGVSKVPGAPNLAGQVDTYLVASLRAYRTGERRNETMNTVAAPLSDTDIDDLAAYYAAIEVTVSPPPRP